MEKLCEELDEAKLELEKLKTECRLKTEQHGNLKKAYDEQVKKLKETSLKAENQGQELSERAEEISMLKQIYEEAKCHLDEKVQIVKRLSAANEKLRADLDSKLQKQDENNRSMVLALEEANVKCADQEQRIKQLEEENRSFKGLVENSLRKCSEAEKESKAPKHMKEREIVIVDLEEECKKVKDQLKWKREQFKHLEEAHSKLRDQFRVEKKEWEKEKSNFLEEICSLQERLYSQIRISEDLEKRLRMCNQSLAYEQGRRKTLEIQLSDFKMKFENASVECEEAKSQLEGLMVEKDREIGNLRHSLGKKEAFYKEIEYRAGQLERENQDLLVSLKELQEAQIHESGSSLAKLRSKLKNVEQIHRDCLSNLRAKEAEWSSKLKKVAIDLDESRSELTNKEIALQEAEKELEFCNSSLMRLMLQNEESSVMLFVLKAGISEAQLKLAEDMVDQQERASLEMQQLQVTDGNLADIIEENDNLKSELQRHKKILEEYSRYQQDLKEKSKKMEIDSEEMIREVSNALDRTHAELAEKICEANEAEFELQIWKSTAEHLRDEIEENRYQRKELESSLLAQAEVEDALKQEKENLVQMLEEKDRRIDCLQQKIETRTSDKNDAMFEDLVNEIRGLEQEVFRREFESTLEAVMGMEMASQLEKEALLQLLEAKNERVNNLMETLSSLEQKFESSSASFSSQLEEKKTELDSFYEAWDKIAAAEILAEVVIEEKKIMVIELEDEIASLVSKLKSQGECLACSKQSTLEVEELEMKKLTSQMEMKLQSSDAKIEELKNEKDKLIKERDDLIGLMAAMDDRVNECCNEDVVLMARIQQLQSFNRSCSSDEVADHSKENAKVHGLLSVKGYEAVSNGRRSPFRELNN